MSLPIEKNNHHRHEHTSICRGFHKKSALLQHHTDTLPAGRGRKNQKHPLYLGICGAPSAPLNPSAEGFLPQTCSLLPTKGKRVFPTYQLIAHCYRFLRETENLSQQPEIHGNLGLPTINITLLQSSLSGVT